MIEEPRRSHVKGGTYETIVWVLSQFTSSTILIQLSLVTHLESGVDDHAIASVDMLTTYVWTFYELHSSPTKGGQWSVAQ